MGDIEDCHIQNTDCPIIMGDIEDLAWADSLMEIGKHQRAVWIASIVISCSD